MSDTIPSSSERTWPGQIFLCPEHIEEPSALCVCGLKPYVPREMVAEEVTAAMDRLFNDVELLNAVESIGALQAAIRRATDA